LLKNKKMV